MSTGGPGPATQTPAAPTKWAVPPSAPECSPLPPAEAGPKMDMSPTAVKQVHACKLAKTHGC